MKFYRSLALIFLLITSLIAQTIASAQLMDREDIRIVVVTHGQEEDSFWDVVQKGVLQAATDLEVEVEYYAPKTFDLTEMVQLIDEAVASEPDGLIVSIPDATLLAPPIQRAIDAGIPVMSINAGAETAAELGVLAHIGQTEREAGFAAGNRMSAAGAQSALCINHEAGNRSLDLRCEGFADAMNAVFGQVQVLEVNLDDPQGSTDRIAEILRNDPSIDSMFTLGPTSAEFVLTALEQEDKLGSITFATFDSSPRVMEAIAEGNMMFAIDQQQYLQGYLPIVYMTLFLQSLILPEGVNITGTQTPIVTTGPGFITIDKVEEIIELSEQGLR